MCSNNDLMIRCYNYRIKSFYMIMYSGFKIDSNLKKTYVIHILHKLNKLAKNPRLVDFSSLVIDLDLGIESCCSSNVEC